MKITKTKNGSAMEVAIIGRLDTESAPELHEALQDDVNDLDSLTMDFAELDYISSAGLRELLKLKRGMRMGGELTVKNASEIVREVFNVTGFNKLITVA